MCINNKNTPDWRIRFARKIAAIITLVFVFSFAAPMETNAQDDGVVRTVFCIGNVNAIGTYPLNAFSVSDNELILAETWRAQPHGVGPVGLAVDPIAEHLYVTYEGENFIDAFDARDATPLTTIILAGTSNLAGIDVRVGDGLLYVVDRGQTTLWVFDSDTFLPVENWPLSGLGGSGAFDLEVIEHWDGRDVIFVSNGAPDVHYYDLDTQEHLGHYDMSREAASMTVDNSSGTPVVFAAAAASGTPSGHSFLLKYDVATDTTDQINLGGNGRGVSVNPPLGLVYVSVGVLLAGNIRVYDQETLTEQNRYPLQGSPTDNEASRLVFGSMMKKEIINVSANPDNSPGEFEEGEDIVFQITVVNKRVADIHILPVTDSYDGPVLNYVSSTIAPSDATDDGEIEFDDLTAIIGHDLAFEEEYSFEITFRAEPEQCVDPVTNANDVVMSGAVDVGGQIIEDQTDTVDLLIRCGCWRDEGCDDGLFCNGEEYCLPRLCFPGASPCSGDTTCNEATDSCDPATDDDVNDDADDDSGDDDADDDADDDSDDDSDDDGNDDTSDDDNDNDDDDGSATGGDADETGGSCCG